MITDILIVGCVVAGLYCELNLSEDKNITVVTKNEASKSDSFLAQCGICVLCDKEDYKVFFEDTMKTGHYENNPDSVETMIQSSQEVIGALIPLRFGFIPDLLFFVCRKGKNKNIPGRFMFYLDFTSV